jgi:hypothetical protein
MGYWQSHHEREAAPWRALGDRYYDQALKTFQDIKGPSTEVAVYRASGLGVYKTSDEFRYLILINALRFDWSDAQVLVARVDGIAERAKEWWGPAADDGKGRQKKTAEAERHRFLDRAKSLMTSVYAAIEGENPRDGQISSAKRSEIYKAKLQILSEGLDRQENEMQDALQRSAQTCYGRGMFYGSIFVALLSAAVGGAFLLGDVPAAYGVAFPAGAAGALVSVLQRMSSSSPSGRLRLDFNAGQQMLTYYGAIRPFVGGLLGYMIFVFLKGSLFPALSIATTAPLATFAGLGFLGGFNERWAQDMLVGSAKRLEQD